MRPPTNSPFRPSDVAATTAFNAGWPPHVPSGIGQLLFAQFDGDTGAGQIHIGTEAMREAARVFVVDSEPNIRETLAAILYQAGYEAIPFPDGSTALSAAAEESPDLVIAEVVMPEMSGVELAIQFVNLYPECKVLLFSGAPAALDLLAGARLHGHEFELLNKPLHPVKLLERLQAL